MYLKNLAKIRKEKGLTQEGLARKADISYHTVIKIESGGIKNPKVGTLLKLAKALGISTDNTYKNYIRLQIGLKISTIIDENFLRNKFYRIIWKLTGFICRFRGKISDRYYVYDNPIWAWSQRIIINEC